MFCSTAKFANILRATLSTCFFRKKRYKEGRIFRGREPLVTIQICSYNEGDVVKKTINAACQVNWPRKKLCVQLLDDSTDQASMKVAHLACNNWKRKGINCQRLTRPDRVGYKAGNLAYHMRNIEGEFVVYMDSDHLCRRDFLLRAMPHFYDMKGNPKYEIGLVQAPW